MPDTGCFALSVFALVSGVGLILFPHPLVMLSRTLNKTLVQLDDHVMRYRYLLALLAFAMSYGMFRLSIFLPLFRE